MWALRSPKRGERELPLPAFVSRTLKRHRAAQAERLMAIGLRPELVVDNGIGEPWLPASFSTGWRRFAKTHGFEGVTFHTLRHGTATLMLAGGVADAVAIKVMGHADAAILRRYQDVVDELKQDAAARMDSLLGG
jgi:integrase